MQSGESDESALAARCDEERREAVLEVRRTSPTGANNADRVLSALSLAKVLGWNLAWEDRKSLIEKSTYNKL